MTRDRAATPAADLVPLLEILCRAPGGPPVTELGTAARSLRSGEHTRVTPTVFLWLDALELRPWDPASSGSAELELADTGRCSPADLLDVFGQLVPVPPSPGDTGSVVRAIWDDPGYPARAVLYFTLDRRADDPDSRVRQISIRTESMAGYR